MLCVVCWMCYALCSAEFNRLLPHFNGFFVLSVNLRLCFYRPSICCVHCWHSTNIIRKHTHTNNFSSLKCTKYIIVHTSLLLPSIQCTIFFFTIIPSLYILNADTSAHSMCDTYSHTHAQNTLNIILLNREQSVL